MFVHVILEGCHFTFSRRFDGCNYCSWSLHLHLHHILLEEEAKYVARGEWGVTGGVCQPWGIETLGFMQNYHIGLGRAQL